MLVAAVVAAAAAVAEPALRLPVPIVEQAPERCGPAALAMVLLHLGADSAAVATAQEAYDPRLGGALVTDLAAAARRAGFAARVATLSPDSLHALLREGTPPVLLYRRGRGPLTRGHYGVLVGWDPAREHWIVHDGGRRPRSLGREDLVQRWRAAGSQALLVWRP
jgi:ABC-type bacteriocin/lantibiotic exporter with double-glycine peptidase domain